MFQAVEKRLFYVWASFNPWDLDDSEIDSLIKHAFTLFNLYDRCSSKNSASGKLVDLYWSRIT
eukprot:10525889-Lingulodinium_polyedra.AAC.1